MSWFERWWISSSPPNKVWSQPPGMAVLGALSQPQGLWLPLITAITIFLRVLFPNSQSFMTPALATVSNYLVELLCVLSLLIGSRIIQLALQAKAESSHQGRKPNHDSHCWEEKEARKAARFIIILIFVNSKSPQGKGCSLKKTVWNSCF